MFKNTSAKLLLAICFAFLSFALSLGGTYETNGNFRFYYSLIEGSVINLSDFKDFSFAAGFVPTLYMCMKLLNSLSLDYQYILFFFQLFFWSIFFLRVRLTSWPSLLYAILFALNFSLLNVSMHAVKQLLAFAFYYLYLNSRRSRLHILYLILSVFAQPSILVLAGLDYWYSSQPLINFRNLVISVYRFFTNLKIPFSKYLQLAVLLVLAVSLPTYIIPKILQAPILITTFQYSELDSNDIARSENYYSLIGILGYIYLVVLCFLPSWRIVFFSSAFFAPLAILFGTGRLNILLLLHLFNRFNLLQAKKLHASTLTHRTLKLLMLPPVIIGIINTIRFAPFGSI